MYTLCCDQGAPRHTVAAPPMFYDNTQAYYAKDISSHVLPIEYIAAAAATLFLLYIIVAFIFFRRYKRVFNDYIPRPRYIVIHNIYWRNRPADDNCYSLKNTNTTTTIHSIQLLNNCYITIY